MNSIRDNLADKSEPVLAELNDCFKIVSATLVPSERGVYITDNKIQCRLQIESYFPKNVKCTKASICIEQCKDDKQDKKTSAKNYKTDLSNNVCMQTSPKKAANNTSADDTINLISR